MHSLTFTHSHHAVKQLSPKAGANVGKEVKMAIMHLATKPACVYKKKWAVSDGTVTCFALGGRANTAMKKKKRSWKVAAIR